MAGKSNFMGWRGKEPLSRDGSRMHLLSGNLVKMLKRDKNNRKSFSQEGFSVILKRNSFVYGALILRGKASGSFCRIFRI